MNDTKLKNLLVKIIMEAHGKYGAFAGYSYEGMDSQDRELVDKYLIQFKKLLK